MWEFFHLLNANICQSLPYDGALTQQHLGSLLFVNTFRQEVICQLKTLFRCYYFSTVGPLSGYSFRCTSTKGLYVRTEVTQRSYDLTFVSDTMVLDQMKDRGALSFMLHTTICISSLLFVKITHFRSFKTYTTVSIFSDHYLSSK